MAFQTSIKLPSPAVSFVGRHNSGKTTLIEGVIACLVASGLNVGSVKHHSHQGFDIDIPGKDSYRHRAAGARETVIASPGQIARIRSIEGEKECSDILDTMPGHDIVVVEGYRKSGLPTIEVMRAGNPADLRVAQVFARAAKEGAPLGVDFVQAARLKPHEIPAAQHEDVLATQFPDRDDLTNKMPTDCTVAIVSDIPEAHKAAALYHIPCFDINDVAGVCAFLRKHYVRHRITVAVQAGGESRRMGQSKATVPFAGRPLICRMVERVSPVADDFIVTTNEAENLGFLHTEYPDLGIRLIPDVYDFRGALPGIYSALQAAKNPYVAIVACDMLCASPSLIAREVIAMDQSGADVVVPVNNHGYEPFHALYRRDVCMEAIKEALSQGNRRAQSFFDSVNVCELPQSEVLKAEPMGGCFINANTPEELHLMEKAFFEE